MAGFLAVLGGAMSGIGSGLVENARAKREAAIEAMKEARADARAKAEREFTAGQNQNAIDARAKESALDREARANEASLGREAEDARTKATLDFQREGRGDLVTLADGTPGVRVGDTWRPLKAESGESVTLKSDKWRTLTADEAASLGLPADKSFQVGPDGEIKQIGGGGTTVNVGDAMKLTEQQSKDLNYYNRGIYANAELAPMEEALTEIGGNIANRAGVWGNYVKSDEYRQAERAGREVLAVILRKDTGAAITKEEMDQYGSMYLPQPNDDAETIAAKREARERAILAIRRGLGTAKPLADEIDQEFKADEETRAKKRTAGPIQSPAVSEDPQSRDFITHMRRQRDGVTTGKSSTGIEWRVIPDGNP